MPHIIQLPSHIADLIAAGEVVERPASVVKELVENAIDGGATQVTVELQHGGMSLIRVTDNGCGIPPEEAPTAFLRHHTSKIRTEYDLEAIGTLGFRGEALAAICAVSLIELLTKRQEYEFGTSLVLAGGELLESGEAGCPNGTTMIVKDLFYNTPARHKFMKTDGAEGAAAFAMVQKLALSHPEVAFTFLRDGKREMQTVGDGTHRSAIYAVLGRDLALGLVPVDSQGDTIQVTGFTSLPTCCRGTRGYQHFFVNGRYVRSAAMAKAVEQGYANCKMVGKFPACVLHLTVKPGSVDVNVHPTKTEVKFSNERELFGAIYHAILSALDQTQNRPTVVFAEKTVENPVEKEKSVAQATEKLPTLSTSPVESVKVSTGGTLSFRDGSGVNSSRKSPVSPPTLGGIMAKKIPTQEPSVTAKPALPTETPKPPVKVATEQVPPVMEELSLKMPTEVPTPTVQPTPQPPKVAPVAEPVVDNPPIILETTTPPVQPWRLVGEVLNTYVIVEQGEDIFLIDKHAAHERMHFDRLKAQGYVPMMQTLLVPQTVTLPVGEVALLLQNLPLLEEFGFQVEEFGQGALLVREAPEYLDVNQVEETLAELANSFSTIGSADPQSARDHLLHTMACKAAIKGGQKNGTAELEVVAKLVMEGNIKHCPHGRPVAITMTKGQLEKQFKRA